MSLLNKCTNCGAPILFGKKDGDAQFCNDTCRNFHLYPGFCPACEAETTDESPGGTFTLNGVGTHLYGSAAPCPTCRSVIKRKWFCVVYIPVIPLKKFRIKPVTVKRYLGRRITEEKLRESRLRTAG